MIVSSEIAPIELEADESRLGRYVVIRQGAQHVAVEVRVLRELVTALCEVAGGEVIALEIGDRRIVVPGPLALPPGEYRALVLVA